MSKHRRFCMDLTWVWCVIVLHISGIKCLADVIDGQLGEFVNLVCPFISTTSHLFWHGPLNLVMYADNNLLNPHLDHISRIAVFGDHNKGRYDLVISNLTRHDEGVYRCSTILNGVSVAHDMMLRILNSSVSSDTTTVFPTSDNTIAVFDVDKTMTNLSNKTESKSQANHLALIILGGVAIIAVVLVVFTALSGDVHVDIDQIPDRTGYERGTSNIIVLNEETVNSSDIGSYYDEIHINDI